MAAATDFTAEHFQWDVIIAHGPCHDGFVAAWSVWRMLPAGERAELAKVGGFYARSGTSDKPSKKDEEDEEDEPVTEFVHPTSPEGAVKLQQQGFPIVFAFTHPEKRVPEELVKDKRVLILDLDMGAALVPLVKASKSTMLCDHHASTCDTIAKYSDVLLKECKGKFATFVNTATSESGASLAWKLTHGPVVPKFVNFIRIGDTWQWDEDENVKPVLEGMYARRIYRSFPQIEEAFLTFEDNFDRYFTEGLAIIRFKETLIKGMAKQCELGYVKTHDGTVYTIAYMNAGTLNSEVAVAMRFYAERRFKVPIHFCATMKYHPKDGTMGFSARSPAAGIDLSVVCRNIVGARGGGHPKASGFNFIGIENLHQVILKEPPKPPAIEAPLEVKLDAGVVSFAPAPLVVETAPDPSPKKESSPQLTPSSPPFVLAESVDRERSPRRAERRDPPVILEAVTQPEPVAQIIPDQQPITLGGPFLERRAGSWQSDAGALISAMAGY